jgi:hypothetical protein
MHQHELHRREEARQREETRRMRSPARRRRGAMSAWSRVTSTAPLSTSERLQESRVPKQ